MLEPARRSHAWLQVPIAGNRIQLRQWRQAQAGWRRDTWYGWRLQLYTVTRGPSSAHLECRCHVRPLTTTAMEGNHHRESLVLIALQYGSKHVIGLCLTGQSILSRKQLLEEIEQLTGGR